MKKLNFVFALMLLLVLYGIATESCNGIEERSEQSLVKTNCGVCHEIPDPKSLTKDIWIGSIMPKMSSYFDWTEVSRFKYANKRIFQKEGSIPMSDTIWAELQNYFVSGGLDKPVIRHYDDLPTQSNFKVKQFENICSGRGITALTIDSENENIKVACYGQLLTINPEGQLLNSLNTGGWISGIFPKDTSSAYLLDPGDLDPHSGGLGSLKVWYRTTDKVETILKGLQRPVHLSYGDNDIFVSEFGDVTGGLGQLKLEPKKYLNASRLPGSYKSFIFDFDKDGNDEIIVIFAQAMEGVYAREVDATNKSFDRLLSFGPEWGISDIDTTDVNHDGWTDLVVVNGDNADFSIIPKAYHGVRVYLNNQKDGFEEAYTFPLHGASQMRTLDANGDGFDDLLVGSYFAEDERDRLMLLLHNGNPNNLNFSPHRFEEANLGNWMVINKGDVDGDGDLDAVIGSFSISRNSSSTNNKDQPNFLLLLNKSN